MPVTLLVLADAVYSDNSSRFTTENKGLLISNRDRQRDFLAMLTHQHCPSDHYKIGQAWHFIFAKKADKETNMHLEEYDVVL